MRRDEPDVEPPAAMTPPTGELELDPIEDLPDLDPIAGLEHRIAVLHWPSDVELLEQLRAKGVPRLLVVTADTPAPPCPSADEDWVRLPASEEDVRTRASSLARRTIRPAVIGDGRIVHGDDWAPLSELEESLARALAERFGEVVSIHDLAACADRELSLNAVRVHLTRLRKRIRALGLVVRAVRGRGYVMETS